MRSMKLLGLTLTAALVLTACGGSDDSAVQFSKMVSFGDSLSDVGTYKVGTVALLGGGTYSINSGTPSPNQNWTQLLAARAGLPAPCAAQTGLDGDPTKGFYEAVKNIPGCFNYAQGGARVTNPVGMGNKLLGGANATLGQLTVPVVTQIQNHLAAVGGQFSGTELVTVLAGANDLFINLGGITAAATAYVTGGMSPTDAKVKAATEAATAMGVAGAELAGYVKALLIGKGAQHVVVVNVPDVSKTPFGMAQDAATQDLINKLVSAFNIQLETALTDVPGVVIDDAYNGLRTMVTTPASFGLSNVTTPACDLSAATNPLGSSLVCTTSNLIVGDTSHYLFSDTVHPSAYGYQLIAQQVGRRLELANWF